MNIMRIFVVAICLLLPSIGYSQSSRQFISIPSSGFTPMWSYSNGRISYKGNVTGTARQFAGSHIMFAPANLPHGSVVTSFKCGGKHPSVDAGKAIEFVLRRNEPQQANVDMATIATEPTRSGFQLVSTTSIDSGKVDNNRFNYYVVASRISATEEDFGDCEKCVVGFCTIGVNPL